MGADVRAWYAQLPRPHRLLPQKRPAAALGLAQQGGAKPGALGGVGTIDAYYLSRHCAVRARPLGLSQLGNPGLPYMPSSKHTSSCCVPPQSCESCAGAACGSPHSC